MAEQESMINSGTVDGLLAFTDYLMEKGYGTGSAVVPWKSAAKQVFSTVEDGDYGAFDVRAFDVDEYMNRFENRARGRYKQESLAAYRSRLKKAVEAYRAFLQYGAIPTFRGSGRKPRADGAPATEARGGQASARGGVEGTIAGIAAALGSSPLVEYPFPLRSGEMARLHLPPRLEKADAERIAAFVRTLVFEPLLALTTETPGPDEEEPA